MEVHTIAYSKSHRDNGTVQARGKIDCESNTLSTGDGCNSQSSGNYVFTKEEEEKDMTDIKFLAGQKAPNQDRDTLYVQQGRVYSQEGISPCLTTYSDKNAHVVGKEDEVRESQVNPKVIGNADVNRSEDDWNGPRDGYQIYDKERVSPALRVNQPGNVRIVDEVEDMSVGIKYNRKEGVKSESDTAVTIGAGDYRGLNRNQTQNAVLEASPIIRIRKLVPVECERLMGWPDLWTKYGTDESGKTYELSDSARYKSCGNGIVSTIPKLLLDHVTGSETDLRVFSTFAGVDGSGMYLKEPKYIKVGFAEYEPKMKSQHASNVLRYHYPEVPNLGDITLIGVENKKEVLEWRDKVATIEKIDKNERTKEHKIQLEELLDNEVEREFSDQLTNQEVEDHDIIFISAPCQSFSSAGKNMGLEDTRGTLFYDAARIMKVKRPCYFIFENVKGLLTKRHERTFEIMCEVYSSLGYELDFELINAKYYGVAQNRERVFMIGRLR